MDRILAGHPAKGLILLGLRGVGKTMLLNRLLPIIIPSRPAAAKVRVLP